VSDRIKELAKKSGLLNRKFMFGQYYEDDLTDEQKKFAELIVKDCIQLADQYGSGGAGSEFDVGYISCANTLSDEFKKRFGVEE
jgi:hypothetical protein